MKSGARENQSWWDAVGSVGAFLLVWEVTAAIGLYDVHSVPRPTMIAAAVSQMATEGILSRDIGTTGLRVIVGFLLGSSAGLLVGLQTGLIPRVRRWVEPLIQLARPIPAVALVPLSILWFGIGESAKLYIVGWACFFPVWVSTHLGVQRVPRDLISTALVLGADRRRMVWEVVLPWSLPFIQSGARVALGLSFAATVVAEMSGASAGLGFRILASHLVFRTDRMIAAILMVGAFGASIDWLFVRTVRWLFPWLEPEPRLG